MTDALLDRLPPSRSWVCINAGESNILRQAQKGGSRSSLFCSPNGIAEHLGQVVHAERRLCEPGDRLHQADGI